jgi:hypothetical protein
MRANPEELESLANLLRARVAERRYGAARAALEQYCRALREAAAALPPGDSRLELLQDDWRKLWNETRHRVLAGRAHAAARLAHLSQPTPLYDEPCLPRHTWACTG